MKNKKLLFIFIITILITSSLTFVVTYKMHDKIKDQRNSSSEKRELSFLHENINDIKKLKKLKDEPDAWYTNYHFVSHSGGGIQGKLYSNSLEAWNLSYENGNRVFDADLMFTTDGEIVLRHENNDNLELNEKRISESVFTITDTGCLEITTEDYPLTFKEFMNSKIYSKYTPLSLENMIDYMYDHKDLYVSVDSKDNVKKLYQKIYDTALAKNKQEILDRIIVSVYDQKSYKDIKKIYNFKNYNMRQYINNPQNYYELAKFCIENNIHVINISKKFITDNEIKLLEEKGIHVYVAVIDYISDLNYYKDKGASGVITNWLYESDWEI